ncbi:hypothetical protein [Pseudodesulfovibrio tunisiensis]|uniref:hypothetical protein n=1 Tax=Pseudodesulfovibrio tunisiensis TaxID=463192 RepID=UPI001FB3C89C|nr:hypothetical protein [Pseudodesulfovibrio tunisiensis]
MSYDIKLVKLVSGDTVIGKFLPEENKIEEPAIIQTVPTQQGVQMMLLPFGYPFDSEMEGEISMDHVMFQYKTCPEELKTKYLEAATNLTLSSGGLNLGGGAAGGGSGSGLIMK